MERHRGHIRRHRTIALALLAAVAACMGDTRPRVVIEWGIAAEELEGADVLIDGDLAGQLRKFGEATRTAFPAARGEHTIVIRHPRIECEPARVTTGHAGQRLLLIAQFREAAGSDGAMKTVLSLRP